MRSERADPCAVEKLLPRLAGEDGLPELGPRLRQREQCASLCEPYESV